MGEPSLIDGTERLRFARRPSRHCPLSPTGIPVRSRAGYPPRLSGSRTSLPGLSPLSQRAAASAVGSSGSVLNAIAALGVDLCTPFTTASNIGRLRGGRRMPRRVTTQGHKLWVHKRSAPRRVQLFHRVGAGTRQRSIRRSAICFRAISMPAWIFSGVHPLVESPG